MPIDLSTLGESLGRGFGEIPPIAIALALLAGPTLALIGYRLITAARRIPTSETGASPYWVCHDCRSINDLRQGRCYHCGLDRDAIAEIEVIVDAPPSRIATFDVPAGSPFAALGGNVDQAAPPVPGPGVPVMAEGSSWKTGVPVVAEDGEALLLADVPADASTADAPLTATTERHA